MNKPFELHWVIALKLIGYWLFAIATFGVMQPLAIYHSLYWYCLEHGLDANGQIIYIRTGIIERDIQIMQLRSVEGIDVQQSFWERIFNLGTVMIRGQGANKLAFKYLKDPKAVAAKIQKNL